jgi:hypothetical protein
VAEETPVTVQAYDDLLNGAFQQFKDLSVKVGGDVKTMVLDLQIISLNHNFN